MQIATAYADRHDEITALFRASFAASEGPDEGAAIAALVGRLLGSLSGDDLRVFLAQDAGSLCGAVLFTPLVYPEDPRRVVLLSPMAVAPDRQGQGIGQALLRHALAALRDSGVQVALTYGDIAFYGRVGFACIPQDTARPPLPLSMPHGWLGQALDGGALAPLRGHSRCVAAFDDPALW
jgi:putative acetyltransferase